MTDRESHNKRIARNSLLLYARLLVTMCVAVYTSRVVLNALGEIDFGIYSAVGGIVIMIAFLNNSMTSATQRFLNFEMANPAKRDLSAVFSTALISHYIVAAIVAIAAETAGLWFVNARLAADIPPERMGAALIVFHCSVVLLVFKIIGSPYTAAVIAHEKMKVFALISILESALTLLLALILVVQPYDMLAAYGVLLMIVGIIVRFVYIRYCRRNFPECRFRWVRDGALFKKMLSFTGWMFAGSSTSMLNTQGLNILIFTYFGPILTTARAMGVKVQGVVIGFLESLMTAVQPQIVKSSSAGDTDYMNRLVFTSSKLSFYIVLLLSLPVLMNTELLLSIWLRAENVNEYTVLFTQLLLADMFIMSAFTPLATVSQASGKVKYFQILISASFVLIFLATWLSYGMGKPAFYAFAISIAVNFIALFGRLFELKRSVRFGVGSYMRRVFIPETLVLAVSLAAAVGITRIAGGGAAAIIGSAIVYLAVALAAIYVVGLDPTEKEFTKQIWRKLTGKTNS